MIKKEYQNNLHEIFNELPLAPFPDKCNQL